MIKELQRRKLKSVHDERGKVGYVGTQSFSNKPSTTFDVQPHACIILIKTRREGRMEEGIEGRTEAGGEKGR